MAGRIAYIRSYGANDRLSDTLSDHLEDDVEVANLLVAEWNRMRPVELVAVPIYTTTTGHIYRVAQNSVSQFQESSLNRIKKRPRSYFHQY